MIDPAHWVEMVLGYVVLTVMAALAVVWLGAVMSRKYTHSSEEMLSRALLTAALIGVMLLAGAAMGLLPV